VIPHPLKLCSLYFFIHNEGDSVFQSLGKRSQPGSEPAGRQHAEHPSKHKLRPEQIKPDQEMATITEIDYDEDPQVGADQANRMLHGATDEPGEPEQPVALGHQVGAEGQLGQRGQHAEEGGHALHGGVDADYPLGHGLVGLEVEGAVEHDHCEQGWQGDRLHAVGQACQQRAARVQPRRGLQLGPPALELRVVILHGQTNHERHQDSAHHLVDRDCVVEVYDPCH
jgi:hypothetical protein